MSGEMLLRIRCMRCVHCAGVLFPAGSSLVPQTGSSLTAGAHPLVSFHLKGVQCVLSETGLGCETLRVLLMGIIGMFASEVSS